MSAIEPRRARLEPVRQDAGLEPRNIDELKTLGQLMHESGLFADTKSAAQAAVKMLAGRELGVGPFSAMAGIHVFMGRAEPSAHLRLAIIQRHGGDLRVTHLDEQSCEVEVVKHGQVVGKVRYTIEQAKKAGVTKNSVWGAHPEDMLFATVVRKASRRFFAGLFFGDAPERNAPVDDAVVVSEVERPALEGRTRQLQLRVLALCTELGWDDEQRHRYTAEAFGGRVSLKDLDDDELEDLYEHLHDLKQADAGVVVDEPEPFDVEPEPEPEPELPSSPPREEAAATEPPVGLSAAASLVIAGVAVEPLEDARPATTDEEVAPAKKRTVLYARAAAASVPQEQVDEIFAARHGWSIEGATERQLDEFKAWLTPRLQQARGLAIGGGA